MSKDKDWLPEELKTIRNLCDIALLLIRTENKYLLPTVLEYLFEEAQKVIDESCVEGK